MSIEASFHLSEEVTCYLRKLGNGRLLLFAHPGYELCLKLLGELQKQFPRLQVTLLTHVALTPAQLKELPVKDVITFDKRMRNRSKDLLLMAIEKVREVRQRRFDGLLIWYRSFDQSPDLLLLETFANISRARTTLFWDDLSGRVRHHSAWRVWTLRWPWTVLKLLVVSVLMLLLWTGVAVCLLLPRRPRRALRHPAPWTIGFLRTDIELSLFPMEVGGSVSHVKGIVEGLLAAGHRVVTYAAVPLANLDPGRVPSRIIRTPIYADLPREVVEALAGFSFALKAYRPMAADGVQIIYQRYSMNNLAGILLARWLRVPLLLEANNSEVVMRRQFSRLTFRRLATAMERFILSRADAVVTVSERNLETFKTLRVPVDRVQVVPNGVNADVFSPERTDGQLRREMGLEGKVVIAFVGLFYPWHGVSYLAKAFVRVAAAVPEAHLLLVGDGDERETVRSILSEAGLESRVTFTGMVPHQRVPFLMQAADILTAPHAPWKEFFGSPIKLFEYMSSGKSVVASNVGQIPQIIRHEENGLLFPAGDVDALAAALISLCRSKELRDRLGRAARQDVLNHHTWEQAVKRSLAGLTS